MPFYPQTCLATDLSDLTDLTAIDLTDLTVSDRKTPFQDPIYKYKAHEVNPWAPWTEMTPGIEMTPEPQGP